MAKFILPPIEMANVRGFSFSNYPINIDLVSGIEKTTFRVSSFDDDWRVNEPVIIFHGIDIRWHFGEFGEEERNSCFNKIIAENNTND